MKTITPSPLALISDGLVIQSKSDHTITSPFARIEFTTTATTLIVAYYNDIYSAFPSLTELGIYLNGVYDQNIAPGANGVFEKTVTLAAGSKLVSIVNGPQSKPTTNILGTFVTNVRGNAALTQAVPAPTSRVLIYGDSIAVGGFASNPTKNAWAMLLRALAYPNSVAVEGWGFRSLYDDTSTAALRAVFVARIAEYNPTTLWMAMGTNDYGIPKQSAANFGAAYAATLDDLNTALPSMSIYCQSPLVRSDESANSFGNTLGDYRTQISTAVSTRTAFATYIDGSTILTTGDLADGVHPNTAGHAAYSAAVAATLGI